MMSVIAHSIIVSRILYALPAWGGFLSVELKTKSMLFSSALNDLDTGMQIVLSSLMI